jgi:hypothetical protein
VNDEGKSNGGTPRAPSGPVSSPRAYFGRASRAATGALRIGITEAPDPGPATPPRRPLVYQAGDPALRLLPHLVLPFPPTAPLTGAIATLSGVRDGEHEKLFIDLGTSLVRATPHRDDQAGTLSLSLSRTQSSETYRGLLASLRYVNDAAAPTRGVRRIALQAVDASGRVHDVAAAAFGVGEVPSEDLSPPPDERVILGEAMSFNTDGNFTLFWWPRLLPGTAERSRRASRAGEPEADAGAANSFFSAGGRVYRLFDHGPGQPAPMPIPQATVARLSEHRQARGDQRVRRPPPPGPALTVANDRAPEGEEPRADRVWMPGLGVPPPGFERARMLRLEDVFGSDMQDAIARRLIEMRLASGG